MSYSTRAEVRDMVKDDALNAIIGDTFIEDPAEREELVSPIIDAAIDHGIVDKRGTWLSFDGQQLGQGRDAARDLLKAEPELANRLMEKIKAKVAAEQAGPTDAPKSVKKETEEK